MSHLHKRDREARRPDKAWRTATLIQLLTPKRVDEFDIVGTFWWYNKTIDIQTTENNYEDHSYITSNR